MAVQHFHMSVSEATPASWGGITGHVDPVSIWHLGDRAHNSGSSFWDGPSCKRPRGQEDRGALSEGWLDHDSLTGHPRVAQVGQPRLVEPSQCQEGSHPTGLLARNCTTLRRGGSSGNFSASQPNPILAQQRPKRSG